MSTLLELVKNEGEQKVITLGCNSKGKPTIEKGELRYGSTDGCYFHTSGMTFTVSDRIVNSIFLLNTPANRKILKSKIK